MTNLLDEKLRFIVQQLDVQFDLGPGGMSTLRSAAAALGQDEHLRLSADSGSLHLQSPTGSSRGWINPEGQAVLQTRYFGDFARATHWDERLSYTRSKLGALVNLLTKGEAVVRFTGITSTARVSINNLQKDEALALKASAAKLCNADQIGDGEPFDFVSRASRAVEDRFFFNQTLTWYQVREATIQVSKPMGKVLVRDWDMTLVDEGLDIVFGWNNKLGLMKGKLDWSLEELVEIASKSEGDRAKLEKIVKALEEGMGAN